MTSSFSALTDALVQFGRVVHGEVSSAMRAFIATFYRTACAEYSRATGRRLPGSERTARLRKKREKAVLAWIEKHITDTEG